MPQLSRGARPLAVRAVAAAMFFGAVAAAQQPLPIVAVRPIEPPSAGLPSEAASAQTTRFSFIAYGDTRSGTDPNVPGDGQVLQETHGRLVDLMVAKIRALASTPQPVRFVIQSGDAVLRGQNGAMWNVSFTPIVERITREGGVPYFLAVGNHDVTGMPSGDPGRALGLHNTLTALSRLIPPEGSPRRLGGYPTYAFGFGNTFIVALDSNIASDPLQLAWVRDQLDRLDRVRFTHVIAVFHHPPFTSGQHGGPTLEPASAAMRQLYAPLFRTHHVRMTIAGHDHLLDHWVERYFDAGVTYRRDDIVTGGGGAPTYVYTGEPDLADYVSAGASQSVRVEHLMAPQRTREGNPPHFLVISIDGDRLSLEVVGVGPGAYAPYAGGRARIELTDRVS
jgi:calcineurin-like phosphoesterase family protein